MHTQLFAAYGPQHWWPASTAFETIVGAYLTQNTAWTSVEISLENLRKTDALTLQGIRNLGRTQLMELIRPSGFATQKAVALHAFVAFVDQHFSGSLEQMARMPAQEMRPLLLDLRGVGPETADAILLYGCGHAQPMADEYLRRICERHGLLEDLSKGTRRSYDALVALLREAFGHDDPAEHRALFNEFHALTVAVGKAHCKRTAQCEGCPLASDLCR